MAGDVFIIGAGFSKAISNEMPVLAELPDYLREPESTAPWEETLSRVNNNVEHMMTLLAQPQPWLSEASKLENRAKFLRFTDRLAVVTGERQGAAICATVECPEWLETLVESWATNQSTVISFNYDTFVEKVYTSSYLSGPQRSNISLSTWDQPHERSSHDLYLVPLMGAGDRRGVMRLGGSRQHPAFQLLKLHGSINWYYSGASDATGEVLYYLESVFGWLPDDPYLGRAIAPDKVPLVVPPTVDKSPFLGHESVRAQWERARFELSMARDVYFLGYSMPETDLMVRFMIQDSLRDRQARAFVVNKAVDQNGDSRVAEVRSAYSGLCLPPEIDYRYLSDTDVLPRFVDEYSKGWTN